MNGKLPVNKLVMIPACKAVAPQGTTMDKGRMEAFSDGVIAIIITITVLDLRVPQGADLASLRPVLPDFLGYLLSFIFLGIYWINHHHLMKAVRHVNGRVLWANLHLLFWLSLIPFVRNWMGENNFTHWPAALYGMVLLLAAFAFTLLVRALISLHGVGSPLEIAVGQDLKGKISLAFYLPANPLAFLNSWLSGAIYALVAVIWLVPDPRIEKVLAR
jgi:uncharacterized membrane protein